MTRALYDCEFVSLTPAGPEVCLVVATHGATSSSPAVGVERDGMVYEMFVSTLPSPAFTCSDVLDLYLYRGSFEAVLADEDIEQDANRWYSYYPVRSGVLPDLRAVDLEPAPRTGIDPLLLRTAYRRICPSICGFAGFESRACTF